MIKPTLTAAALVAAASFGTAHADELDTFKIDVVLEDLASMDASESFEKRLRSAARRYCDGADLGPSRRAARQCERLVIAAVAEAIEDQARDEGIQVAFGRRDS